MDNIYHSIRQNLTFNKFELGDLLFVEYTCPLSEDDIAIYSQTDYIVHVLSGKKVWKTNQNHWVVETGDTIFIRKGAFFVDQYFDDEFCMFGFFIPDDFIRTTIREITGKVPSPGQTVGGTFEAERINSNDMLDGFFKSMYPFFKHLETPSAALLELKLKELIINVLCSKSNPRLSAYFQSLIEKDRPYIPEVMERNFSFNLSLEEFAKLCHRSLSSFKRDFHQHFEESPGKWLLNKRLDYASILLRTQHLNISRAAYQSGFEDASHFSRAFKHKFGLSPNQYRNAVRT